MSHSPGRRLAPHFAVALALAGVHAVAAAGGKTLAQPERAHWVTPLRIRSSLLGESVK